MSSSLTGQSRRGRRRQAREVALCYLFQNDFDLKPWTQDLIRFFSYFSTPAEIREFAEFIIQGVLRNREALDIAIEEASEHWKIYRMEAIDRCLLRLAAFELQSETETDMPVIIDEAVELARQFGGTHSASFVNGVLDKLAKKYRGDSVSVSPSVSDALSVSAKSHPSESTEPVTAAI